MINWSNIISECGLENLTEFAYGNMSKSSFRSFGSNCRRAAKAYNVDRLRDAAQRAVRHRTTARQRSLIIS